MYRFLILAFEKELTKEEMEDHFVPGALTKVTEIWLLANTAADALAEARKIIIAKNYHIRKIEKMYQTAPPPGNSPSLPGASAPLA